MAARKRSTHANKKHVPPRPGLTPRGVERDAGELVHRGRRGVPDPGGVFELDPLAYLRALVRDVPDFPRPGILFKTSPPSSGTCGPSRSDRRAGRSASWVTGSTRWSPSRHGGSFQGRAAARLNRASSP
jgi:hypothetical protein